MHFDFIVIGAGMAGLSMAAELSRSGRVAVIERETQPGYHSTGRSAALFSELYGNATIRGLTRGSRSFLFNPPAGFADHPLVSPRGTLYFAATDELASLDALALSLGTDSKPLRLDAAETLSRLPVFKPGYLGGALYEQGSVDIDVAALLQGYGALCHRQHVSLFFNNPVEAIVREGALWQVRSATTTLRAPVVVNAAGAWGDVIAQLAGVAAVGLVPKRRTAVTIDVPGGISAQHLPAAVHAAETFYFKPDAGRLLLSPADETPSDPCDAQPEEIDIAIAVDKFETASGSTVRRLHSRWAGLRSFVADKTPVVGFDDQVPGFFWLVGQGGYGIQTAPAMARAASALARHAPLPADLLAHGVSAEVLAPGRPSLHRAS